jgi:hypothetical protein
MKNKQDEQNVYSQTHTQQTRPFSQLNERLRAGAQQPLQLCPKTQL